jgi:tetratricopeptide (TPR) repeat protein
MCKKMIKHGIAIIGVAILIFLPVACGTVVSIKWDMSGDKHYENKEYDEAISDYTEAIRLDPKYYLYYLKRGNAYFAESDYDKAIADYDISIQVANQSNSSYGLYARGLAYEQKGDINRAIADFEKAISVSQNENNKDTYRYNLERVSQVANTPLGSGAFNGKWMSPTSPYGGYDNDLCEYTFLSGNYEILKNTGPTSYTLYEKGTFTTNDKREISLKITHIYNEGGKKWYTIDEFIKALKSDGQTDAEIKEYLERKQLVDRSFEYSISNSGKKLQFHSIKIGENSSKLSPSSMRPGQYTYYKQ